MKLDIQEMRAENSTSMCSFPRNRRLVGLAAAVWLCSGIWSVHADGCLLPSDSVPGPVSTPRQHAVIKFHDGIETLILSSDVRTTEFNPSGKAGNSREYLWLLALPREPRRVDVVSPFGSDVLTTITGPHKLVFSTADFLSPPITLCIFTIVAWFGLRRRMPGSGVVFKILLGLTILVSLAALVLMVAGASRSGLSSEGIISSSLANLGTLGLVEMNAVRPKSPEELGSALRDKGVTLPAESVHLIKKYIADDWLFYAVKLRQVKSTGLDRTPSLQIEFESEKPVYPMRLTRLSSEESYLNLIVIADEVFNHDRLLLQSALRCHKKAHDVWQAEGKQVERNSPASCDVYELEMLPGATVGFPCITDLLWDGCVLTSLSGAFGRDGMEEDLYLHNEKLRLPYCATVTRSRVVGLRSALYASLVGLVWILCIAGAWNAAVFSKGRRTGWLNVSIITVLTLGIVLCVGTLYYASIDKTDEKVQPRQRIMNTDQLGLLMEQLSAKPELSQEKTREKILGGIRQSLGRRLPYATNAQDFFVQDFFLFFEDERGLVCRVYDVHEDEAVERSVSRPGLRVAIQPESGIHRERLSSHPGDIGGTFLGEPADIVLMERSDPRWSAE